VASLHSVPRRLFVPPTACGQRTLYISELGRRFRWNKILEPDVYPGGKAVVVKGNEEGWEKWENVCVRGICFNVDASTKYNTRIKFGIGVTQRSRPTTPLHVKINYEDKGGDRCSQRSRPTTIGANSGGYRGYSPSKNLSEAAKYCISPPQKMTK